jgi:hypothetical protein
MDYGSKKPLHFQNRAFAKAMQDKNPSYESFRANIVHKPQYTEGMDSRATVSDQSRMRRGPDGKLSIQWAGEQILLAIKRKEYGEPMTPLENSLLTIIFPKMYRILEPAQAEINTQLSDSEKEALKEYVVAKMRELDNWNSGFGGSSVPGRSRTDVGG